MGAEHPPHFAAADEAEVAHAAVGHHFHVELMVGRQERLAPRIGQAGFAQNRHKPQATQRRRGRRFHDHRTTGRHRRANLVYDHVQGMVERAEGQHDADGLILRKGEASGRGRVAIHGDLASRLGPQVLGAQADAVDRPVHFHQRIGQGLAPFASGLEGEILAASLHDGGSLAQDGDAFGGTQPAVAVAEQLVGGGQCPLDAATVHLFDRSQPRAVEGGADFGVWRDGARAGNHQREMLDHGRGLLFLPCPDQPSVGARRGAGGEGVSCYPPYSFLVFQL